MKRDPVQTALAALATAARQPQAPETATLVRASLAHRSPHVVARAARAAREAELTALAPELAAAFPRFLEDPVRRDPGCVAKLEIVRALDAFEARTADVYLAGARHVQREPAFGPPIDTAAELRGTCAMALVARAHPEALAVCVGLLVDREPLARMGALRALGASARPDVALTLRLFVLRGDPEPDVLAEAFTALLVLEGSEAVPFVAERLAAAEEDAARAAAVALGACRFREAALALQARLPAEDRREVRRTLMLALATSRDDAAIALLLDLVVRGSAADARAALEAFRIFAHDDALQARVQAASRRRRHPRSR